MTKPVFSAQVLQSYDAFERFLYSPDAIAEIKKEAHRPYVRGEHSMGPWKVTWLIVTAPLRICYVVFIRAVGYASIYIFQAEKVGNRLLLHAEVVKGPFAQAVHRLLYGANVLVSTCNDKSQDAEDLHTHQPIDIVSITSEKRLNKRMVEELYVKNNQLYFDELYGQCHGISELFAHLYFSTRPFFSNAEQHLVAVAKIFANGAPSEAALWQRFQEPLAYENVPETQSFLGLQKTPSVGNGATAEKISALFQKLEPGLYALSMSKPNSNAGHRINLIKEKESAYLLDPNAGLIAPKNGDDLKESCNQMVALYGSLNKVERMTQEYFSAMAFAA